MQTKKILTVAFIAAVGFSPGIARSADADTKNAQRQAEKARPARGDGAQPVVGREGKRDNPVAATDRLNRILPSQKLLKMDVKNLQGENLAGVDDVVVDLQRGVVAYIILEGGGFLDMGDKLVAVPSEKFQVSADRKHLVLDVSKEKLLGAPAFEKTTWPDPSDRAWREMVDAYHGRNLTGAAAADIDAKDRLGYQRVSKLDHRKVQSVRGGELGEIQDLMVDVPSGKVLFVVIADKVNGKLANVPPTVFQAGPDKDIAYLNTDKQALERAPQWDFDKNIPYTSKYIADSYRHYSAPAGDWEGTTDPSADNTRRNVRDRQNDTLTPLDQGTSELDREITRQIRKWIVVEPGEDRFTTQAQNIKIITRDGKVTLRGVVATEAEKKAIDKYARELGGVVGVENQLTVKGK